jgi:hypothetical protein
VEGSSYAGRCSLILTATPTPPPRRVHDAPPSPAACVWNMPVIGPIACYSLFNLPSSGTKQPGLLPARTFAPAAAPLGPFNAYRCAAMHAVGLWGYGITASAAPSAPPALAACSMAPSYATRRTTGLRINGINLGHLLLGVSLGVPVLAHGHTPQ